MKATRILFVCHGNICRSPMAECIFRDLVDKAGLRDRFAIASAATSREELGHPVYPPARQELAKHGISCGGKRAVLLVPEDYGRYDLFLGMDEENMQNMRRLFDGDPEGKCVKLLSLAGRTDDVADPWYIGRFDRTYRDLEEGCRALLERLTRQEG